MDKQKLSIIMPAFNEEITASLIIKAVSEIKFPYDVEIIFVNDGSTDSTLDKISELQPKMPNLKIISYKNNRGKGFAVRTGLLQAHGDFFIIQDADLEYNPSEIPVLINPLVNGLADVVMGNRMADIKKKNIYYFFNITVSSWISILFCKKINDFGGCYKAFTKKVKDSLNLKVDGFGFDIEFVSKSIKNKFKIIEMPVTYMPRSVKEGKKINWIDGIKAIIYIIRFRFFI